MPDKESQLLQPIPSAVRQLVELFGEALTEIQFPDVTHAKLTELCQQVETSADALKEAQAQVAEATIALEETQTALLKRAKQALAYAKVFAEDDVDLSDRLAQISLDERGGKRKSKKSNSRIPQPASEEKVKAAKRKPKKKNPGLELPLSEDGNASSPPEVPEPAEVSEAAEPF